MGGWVGVGGWGHRRRRWRRSRRGRGRPGGGRARARGRRARPAAAARRREGGGRAAVRAARGAAAVRRRRWWRRWRWRRRSVGAMAARGWWRSRRTRARRPRRPSSQRPFCGRTRARTAGAAAPVGMRFPARPRSSASCVLCKSTKRKRAMQALRLLEAGAREGVREHGGARRGDGGGPREPGAHWCSCGACRRAGAVGLETYTAVMRGFSADRTSCARAQVLFERMVSADGRAGHAGHERGATAYVTAGDVRGAEEFGDRVCAGMVATRRHHAQRAAVRLEPRGRPDGRARARARGAAAGGLLARAADAEHACRWRTRTRVRATSGGPRASCWCRPCARACAPRRRRGPRRRRARRRRAR